MFSLSSTVARDVSFESLEKRALMSTSAALHDADHGHSGRGDLTVLYTESNSPESGKNAVLAFERDPRDGSLHQIGKFLTHGTGQPNPAQAIGENDSDQEVIASPDGQFLFAVNQGSNSIATFRIEGNGRLRRIGTFDSGGVQPVSLGLAGDKLYVVNRGDVSTAHAGTVAPNYTAFNVHEDGTLSPLANSTIALPVGLSPSQSLVSKHGKFVFGDNFAVPGTSPALGNTIEPFTINSNGTLAPGAAVGTSGITPPLLLGLAEHPTQRIIYAGLTGAGQVGVFTYDTHGAVTFVGAVSDQGAGPCWATVSGDGKFLYVANTGTDSVGVFSLADPLHPSQLQEVHLAGPYAPSGAPTGTVDTAAFELALDPTGKSLYVVDQTTAPNHDFQQGNALHVLSVGTDGKLAETGASVLFSPNDVSADARPQGIAIVNVRGEHHNDDHRHDDDRRPSAPSRAASPFSFAPIHIGTISLQDLLKHVEA
jgi:6-phosphogluconolactonase (cycloisomerase 2 family)